MRSALAIALAIAIAPAIAGCTLPEDDDGDASALRTINEVGNLTGGNVEIVGRDGIVATSDAENATLRLGHRGLLLAPNGSVQACRTDDCDPFEYPSGMVIAEGSLLSHNNLTLNVKGPDHDSGIFFFEDGLINGAYVRWFDAEDRFEASDDLEALGNVTARHHVGTVTTVLLDSPLGSGLAQIETAATEGNEVTVFLRGSGKLANGTARIEFPAPFKVLVQPNGPLTAQVTPTSRGQALIVSEKGIDHIVVETVTGGSSEQTFDYFVQATRAGSDGFQTIR